MAELVQVVLKNVKEWVEKERPRQIIDKPWRIYAKQIMQYRPDDLDEVVNLEANYDK